jgi:RNA polymerase sigma factor (sigma-70 family)
MQKIVGMGGLSVGVAGVAGGTPGGETAGGHPARSGAVPSVEPPMGDPTTDADLLRAIAAGDEAALARAYDAHGGLVFALAQRVCRRPEEAEEVLQVVFLTLWRTADRFDATRGSLVAWLATMARNRAIDRLRARALPDGPAADVEPVAPSATPSPVDRAGTPRRGRARGPRAAACGAPRARVSRISAGSPRLTPPRPASRSARRAARATRFAPARAPAPIALEVHDPRRSVERFALHLSAPSRRRGPRLRAPRRRRPTTPAPAPRPNCEPARDAACGPAASAGCARGCAAAGDGGVATAAPRSTRGARPGRRRLRPTGRPSKWASWPRGPLPLLAGLQIAC